MPHLQPMLVKAVAAVLSLLVPVSFPETETVSPTETTAPESNFGSGLFAMSEGVLVTGQVALGPTFGSVITRNSETGEIAKGEVVTTTGPMTAGANDLVAGLDDGTVRVWRWDGAALRDVVSTSSPGDGLVTAGPYVVISDENEINVHELSDEGELALVDTLNVDLTRLRMAMTDSGDILAVSGVPRLAGAGDLVIFQRTGPAGQPTWSELSRFSRIGGGPVHMSGPSVLVQRNGFFTESSGPWTVLQRGRFTSEFELVGEVPGVGAAITMLDDLVVVGDPDTRTVFTFQRTAEDRWPFKFLQAIRSPGQDGERFGSTVAAVGDRLLIGSPGATVDGTGEEGLVRWFGFEDGPVGCNVVGTSGDDVLVGTSRPDRICGLSGDDNVRGLQGSDFIDGGAGLDTVDGGDGNDVCEAAEVVISC